MGKVIVCDGNTAERERLIDLARQCLQGKEVQVTGCTYWPELDGMVKQVLPDAVIVVQDGVEGLNTITRVTGQKNPLAFRYGLLCAGIPAMCPVLLPKAGIPPKDGAGNFQAYKHEPRKESHKLTIGIKGIGREKQYEK